VAERGAPAAVGATWDGDAGKPMTTIVWFRNDLRLADNPALWHAAARGPVLPVFIWDDTDPRPPGGASRWWLHHSLQALRARLGSLIILRGDPLALLTDLATKTAADAVFWNRCYEPHAIARDKAIKTALKTTGHDVRSFNGALLHEPWDIATGSGGPYKVFSAYWRAARGHSVAPLLGIPDVRLAPLSGTGLELSDLDLLPRPIDWAADWSDIWTRGEVGARARFDAFVETGLIGYAEGRDRPERDHVSRLSPHLHFGEISPRDIWHRINALAVGGAVPGRDAEKLLSELGWREFSHHLLYHFPSLPERNWKSAFDVYPWRDSKTDLTAWQKGMTGYPMVDAGMRELWQTGYMHNRARMVAASFLVKHLRIDWRHGETWFWDTLVDADLANNVGGWQWVAGSGADAAPYFRIFNPVTQGKKFDPDGAYVRRWCPELSRLDTAHIHAPFEAPKAVLQAAGITLGATYPAPIVDHAKARKAALDGFQAVKMSAGAVR